MNGLRAGDMAVDETRENRSELRGRSARYAQRESIAIAPCAADYRSARISLWYESKVRDRSGP